MNPALVSVATSMATDRLMKKSPETGMTNSDLQFAIYKEEQKNRRRKIALYTIGGLAVIIVGRKLYKDYKERKSQNDQSPKAQIAREFQSAMYPSGFPKWIPDGTNEEKIYELAKRIKDENLKFDDVATQYRNIYKSELMTDLQSELKTDEFSEFQSLLSENSESGGSDNGGNGGGIENNPEAVYILTKESGDFYENPDDYFGTAFLANRLITNAKLTGNIKPYYRDYFKLVKVGDLYEIQTVTGKFFYVKTDKIERLTPEVFKMKMQNKFVQKSQIVKK